jgi:anti-anti-sigma factor
MNDNPGLSYASPHLNILAEEEGCLHVEYVGSLDATALPEGSDLLGKSLGREVYSRRVLLNCEKVEYLDTSGITWLIDCQKRFIQAGGLLVLHSMPPRAYQLVKLLHLERLFHIQPDYPAARTFVLGAKP